MLANSYVCSGHSNCSRCPAFLSLFLSALRSERGFPGSVEVKNPPDSAGDARDMSSIPGSGISPGEITGNPLRYPCWWNLMDRGTWRAIGHGVASHTTERSSTHLIREASGLRSLNDFTNWPNFGKKSHIVSPREYEWCLVNNLDSLIKSTCLKI